MRLKDAMKDMLDTLRDIKNAIDGESPTTHLYPSWDAVCEAAREANDKIVKWFWGLPPDARNGAEFLDCPTGGMDIADELILAAHHGDREFVLLALLFDDSTEDDINSHVATLQSLLGSTFRVSWSLNQGRYTLGVRCDIHPATESQPTTHLYPSWDATCEAIDNARKANMADGKPETRFTLSVDAESDCYVLTVG